MFLNFSISQYPGLVSQVLMKKKEMEVQANLKSIVILDCNQDAFYQKVSSAIGLPSVLMYLNVLVSLYPFFDLKCRIYH